MIYICALGGQSNMEGRSSLREAQDTDVTNVWQIPGYPSDPNYNQLTTDITPLISRLPFAGAGDYGSDRVGPGEYICRSILNAHPTDKVILVPCGVGGTYLAAGGYQWSSSPNLNSGGTYWSEMVNRTLQAISLAQTNWPSESIEVILFWSQGEFDAGAGVTKAQYQTSLTNLVNNWRTIIPSNSNGRVVIGSMIPRRWVIGSPNYIVEYAAINAAQVAVSVALTNVNYIKGPGDHTVGSEDFLHYSPVDYVRQYGTAMGDILEVTIGPNMTSANTVGSASGNQLSLTLEAQGNHKTFHINGGADASHFQISDMYLSPKLQWAGNGTGPADGTYEVDVRARDGAGNYGPTQTITVTVSSEVHPSTFFTSGESGVGWDLTDTSLTNMAQNIDGTGQVTVGSVVGWLKNIIPGGSPFIAAANNTTRPTYQIDSNGKPYLLFDGVNDVLFSASLWVRTDNGENTAILGLNGVTTATKVTLGQYPLSGSSIANALRGGGSGVAQSFFRNSASSGHTSANLPAFFDGNTKVGTQQYGGGQATFGLRNASNRPSDGALTWDVSSFTGSIAETYVWARTSLGATGGSTPANFFSGRIYSGFAINRLLTALEVKAGEEWVGNRSLATPLPGQTVYVPETAKPNSTVIFVD